ncbi:hypothetical protein CR513_53161, partial [Mucuna pruriens]
PLTRLTRRCETSQKDKVITLGPHELPNLVSSYRLDDRNYLQWAQHIRTTLKGCKKLNHIEGNNAPRNDPKFSHYDMAMELYDYINKFIWENLIETYSMKKDSTTCYDFESKIFNYRQGTLSII